MTSDRTRGPRHPAALAGVLALGLALVVTVSGCVAAQPSPTANAAAAVATSAGTAIATTIAVGGVERGYRLSVPARAVTDAPLPLLLVVHGAGSSAERVEQATGMTGLAAAAGFIVAYPEGTQAAGVPGEYSWNAGACCGTPVLDDVDDVGFISAMLARIEAEHPVDPERVFVAGFSNGGMLAYRLACELDGRFAGIAVVAGALNVADCRAPAATSVLVVHGTGDLTVPYEGGGTTERAAERFGRWKNASVEDAVAYWSKRDGCAAEPVSIVDGGVTRESFEGCETDVTLDVVTIAGGGHVWPSAEKSGFDASTLIVDRFGLGAPEVVLAR